MRWRPRTPVGRLEATGAAVGAALVAWLLWSPGRPVAAGALRAAAVVAAAVALVLLLRRTSARTQQLALLAVALSPAPAVVATGARLAGDGPTGYANASAAWLLLAAAAALAVAVRAAGWGARWTGLLLGAVWLVVPWVSGAAAAAAWTVVLVPAAVLTGQRARRWLVGVGTGVVLLLLAGTVAVGAAYEPGPLQATADDPWRSVLGDLRPQVWSDAVGLVADHPWTGIGWDGFAGASTASAIADVGAWAHSGYLHWTAETGLPGGALLLALIGWALTTTAAPRGRRGDVVLAAGVVGVCLQATFDHVLHLPVVPLSAAVLVGVVGASTRPPAPADRAAAVPAGTVAATVAAALATLVLLLPVGPLDPPSTTANRVVPVSVPTPGLRFDGGLATAPAPARLYTALTRAGGATFEVGLVGEGVPRSGPARILSFSAGPGERNLTIAQAGADLVVRVRTGRGDPNGTAHEQRVPGVLTEANPRRVTVAVDRHGIRVLVDGQTRRHARVAVSLADWDPAYPLVLGNEVGGGRPWRGTLTDVTVSAGTRPVDGEADRSRPAPRPLVRYRLGEAVGGIVPDRVAADVDVPLSVPARIRVGPPARPSTVLEPFPLEGRHPGVVALRFLGTAALLAAVGRAVARARHVRVSRPSAAAVVAVAVAAAVAVELLQWARGGTPSVPDVAVAVTALTAGFRLPRRLRDRRSVRPPRAGAPAPPSASLPEDARPRPVAGG